MVQPETVVRTPWPRVTATSIGLAIVVTVLLVALLWPMVASRPKNIPLALAGPEVLARQFAGAMTQRAPGTFDITVVADRDAAVALIRQRRAYGAIVLGPQPEILTTSAGSPIVAQMLGAFAPALQAQMQAWAMPGPSAAPAPAMVVKTTDVVPLAAGDRGGIGMVAAALPLLMGGILGGVAIGMALTGASRRVAGLLIYALAGGFVVPAILQNWNILQGSFLPHATLFTLALAAVAAPVAGFIARLGIRGAAVGPLLFMLFANPISSIAAPQQFLPAPWGAVGQWFPPGAEGTLIRSLSYFPDADNTTSWLVLVGWTLLGVVLIILGGDRKVQPR